MAHVTTRSLRRYAEIGRILVRYGRSDLVRHAGLEGVLAEDMPDAPVDGAEPARLVADLESLGPTFVKLGQFLSTRADLLPNPYAEALSRLQDDVDPIGYAAVEGVVEAELGARMSKLFDSFDVKPAASASLGQVHHAVMRDGRQVAVKVQRPGIRERVAEDLDVIDDIARLIDAHTEFGRRQELRVVAKQLRESLVRELDYRQEARNLVTLARNLADIPLIVIPQPVSGYTSSHVLTMDLVRGRKITEVTKLRRIDVDGPALADSLFRAYLAQVLVDGYFHADPHPGNVFLTDDGRIALLDLGMVARLSPRMRDQLVKLMVSIGDGAGDDTADVAFQMCRVLPELDRETARREIASLVAWNEGLAIQDIDVGRVVVEITRIAGRNGLRVPPELTLLGKALLSLDLVARCLDPSFDPNAAVREHVSSIALQRARSGASLRNFAGSLVDARDFMRALPRQAHVILDKLANDGLKVTVEAIDEDRLISGLQKIANRITVGLILAALIVGAALVMRVETTWKLAGYPVLAVLLFVSAALGAAWMAVHILLSDWRSARHPARSTRHSA